MWDLPLVSSILRLKSREFWWIQEAKAAAARKKKMEEKFAEMVCFCTKTMFLY